MFKRLNLVALSLISLLSVSCDRQTTAELVLSFGINAVSDSPLSSLQASIPADESCEISCARNATDRLIELRSLQLDSEAAEAASDRAAVLIGHIADLVTETEAVQGSDSRLVIALLEAQLAGLAIAADLDPLRYRDQRDAFHLRIIEEHASATGSDRDSVRRVFEVLSQARISQDTRDLVALHAATYPQCEMNIELFLTASMQFANERKFSDAIDVAEEGIALCGELSNVGPLSERLAELTAKRNAS